MQKNLNFNKVNRPTLLLTMPDEAQTQLKVGTPSEALIQELTERAPELENIMKSGNKEAINEMYILAAKLISCNRDFIPVTADDLRGKYGLDFEALVIFYSTYLDFIEAVNNEKN